MSKETTSAETTSTAAAKETTETPATAAEKVTETTKAPDTTTATKVDEKPVVPEKYELKSEALLKSDLEEIEAAAKAKGLSQADAQKLVEGREADYGKFKTRQQDEFNATTAKWLKEAESDKELAGADGKSFKENVEHAHRGMKALFGEDINKFLSETKLGNHPGIIKGFARYGRQIANDKADLSGKSSSPQKGKSREEKLYGSHFKDKKE